MPISRIKGNAIHDDAITSARIDDGTITILDISDNVGLPGTDSVTVPKGTTAQRGTGVSGKFRFNTDTTQFEGYDGSAWSGLGGASGTNGEKIIYENENQIDNNYTITTGYNALSAGPITLADGVEVTIPTGSSWTIVGDGS